MQKYLLLLLILSFSSTLWSENRVDSLLHVLDQTISQSSYYEDIKNKKIALLKQKLKEKKQTKEKQYQTNSLLIAEYEAYNFDSAMHYMNLNLQIATELENEYMLNECKLWKTRLLSIAGIYVEGMKIIESINKSTLSIEQLRAYYIEYKNLYLYQAEYATGSEYRTVYLQKMNAYLDSVLTVVPVGSYHYVTTKVSILINNQEIAEAEKLLLNFLQNTTSDTREYSIITSILAFLYSFDNRTELRKEYLIKSAISDIKAVVKENNSIRTLGEILYEEGKTERAYNYMKISMDDANYFNARLRNLQSSKMLSVINKTYLTEKIER